VSFPPPVSEGYFSCLVMEHSASVPVDPANALDAARVSVWHVHLAEICARDHRKWLPGPGWGQVAASQRVRRFSKITMV
jgi:hypothetical protein